MTIAEQLVEPGIRIRIRLQHTAEAGEVGLRVGGADFFLDYFIV